METVTHHGRRTAYRHSDRGGAGPTTLFVHGSGGSHAVWKSQFRLSDAFPVAAVDLSGHGESEDVDAEAGYTALSAYVDDALAVAEAVDADVLVGNSLGGAVLLTLALERDYDPAGLVLAGTGARLSVLADLLSWLADDFDRAVEFLHEPDHLLHDPDEATLAVSRAGMRDAGRAVTERDFRSCHSFDVRGELGEIDTPALALVGEHDRLTPPAYHEYLAEELPNCAYAEVADAAHLSMLEAPEAFNDRLSAFVAGLE
jgi:pimeloyl-ACP methyl ester carboxylesterase